MVHQPKHPADYFSAPAAIHFLAIPVPLALHLVINFTTAETCKTNEAASVAASLWRFLVQHVKCNCHRGFPPFVRLHNDCSANAAAGRKVPSRSHEVALQMS